MLIFSCHWEWVSGLYAIQSLRELKKWRAKGTLLTNFFISGKKKILPNKKEMWFFFKNFVPLFVYFKAKRKYDSIHITDINT
jgi:hypothetical protein